MGDGLKKQWGVGDPAKAGSDKQAQQFKAAFQAQISCINGHLQYTSANAEAAKHDPLAARRDALYPAFQSANGQIDPANPSKAQGAIDKVLGDAKALSTESAALKAAAEKALADWKARQPKFDAAVHQVEELEAWEDPKAGSLRALVDGIRTQTNERRYAPACTTVDALLPKLKPIFDEYLKQKEAKPKYEQMLAEQSARLDPLKAAERPSQPMTAKAGEADAAMEQARPKADAKDFVGGLEQLKGAKTAIDALDKLAKDPERAKFLAVIKEVEEQVVAPEGTVFKSQEADWSAITQAKDQAIPAGDSGDYAGANKTLADLKTKLDAFKKKHDELEKQKQEYDAALATLQPRLAEVSVSEPQYAKLQPQQQEMATVQTEMEAAAQSEDFAKALELEKNLATKVDAYETAKAQIDQLKQDYETALSGLQPRLQASSVSEPQYTTIQPQQLEMAAAQSAMEAAAQAFDYEKAMELLQDLTTKLEAYEAAKSEVDKQKEEYEAAWAALEPKLKDALLSARAFKSLDAARTVLTTGQSNITTAATANDFAKALQTTNELAPKVEEYLKNAKVEEDKVAKKAADITKQLDGATDATRGDVAKAAAKGLSEEEVKALPADVRNRLLSEMQKGGLTDDEKTACKVLFSEKYLDPKFEKIDDENQKKLLEKMKNDPDFKKARDNWNTMTEAERVAIMKKAVDYQAEAYGIPKTTIATYSKNDATDYGYYSHDDGKLFINSNDAALKNGGFDEAIDTAVHENAHRYQYTLIDQLNAGTLKPGDPLYDQAMTFKLNAAKGGYYVQPKANATDAPTPGTGDEYFTQPKEYHSRRTGEAVKNAGIGK